MMMTMMMAIAAHLEEGRLGGVHAGGTGLDHHVVGGGETHAGGCSDLVLVDLHLHKWGNNAGVRDTM